MNLSLPFFPLLCLIFVIAKLWGYITWSWWLVFAPIIIGPALALAFWGIALLVVFIGVLLGIK